MVNDDFQTTSSAGQVTLRCISGRCETQRSACYRHAQLAVTGLTARTAYAFRVVAYDAAGNRAESALPVTTLPPASSGRGAERPGFKYRSRKPYDISAFDRISGRGNDLRPTVVSAGKGFINFSPNTPKAANCTSKPVPTGLPGAGPETRGLGGHYQVTSLKDNKIDTFFNYHPNGNMDRRTNLYYMQTTDMGKTWTTADGKPLRFPLADVQNPALVINYEAEGKLQYHMDLELGQK